MRLHDWSRVDAGTWHGFHLHWISRLCEDLNNGRLPAGYYADAERAAVERTPDVLAIEQADVADERENTRPGDGTAAVMDPPELKVHATVSEVDLYTIRNRRVAIRRDDGDRLAAVIELASPGNKTGRRAIEAFTDKAATLLGDGVHLGIIDVVPTSGRLRPNGLIAATAETCNIDVAADFVDKRGGIAGFEAPSLDRAIQLWAEPLGPGDSLPELPLFLTPGRHVNVPLTETYVAALRALSPKWRRVLDA